MYDSMAEWFSLRCCCSYRSTADITLCNAADLKIGLTESAHNDDNDKDDDVDGWWHR